MTSVRATAASGYLILLSRIKPQQRPRAPRSGKYGQGARQWQLCSGGIVGLACICISGEWIR
jgi:hypothetical protein